MILALLLAIDTDSDIIDADGNLIAVIMAGKATYSKLFVAAPDLLEFAKQVVKFAADHSNYYLMAWAQDVVNNVQANQ